MVKRIEELNNMHLDVLREIGNIGAGNAATALAQLISKKVNMGVPRVNILEFSKVSEILGDPEAIVVGIMLKIKGDLTGNILFVLQEQNARALVGMLTGTLPDPNRELNDLEISALKELGNILTGSYLSSLATLTNLKIISSIPHLAIDMAGAILSVPAIEFGKLGDTVLYIETEISDGDYKVVGDFFLVPELDMYDILMKSLGVNN
jgi:chemotaxis protein CheC